MTIRIQRKRVSPAVLATLLAVLATPSWAHAEEALFEKVYCLRHAVLLNYPLDGMLRGAPRDQTLDAPIAMCVAKRGSDLLVMDSAAGPWCGSRTGAAATCSPRIWAAGPL